MSLLYYYIVFVNYALTHKWCSDTFTIQTFARLCHILQNRDVVFWSNYARSLYNEIRRNYPGNFRRQSFLNDSKGKSFGCVCSKWNRNLNRVCVNSRSVYVFFDALRKIGCFICSMKSCISRLSLLNTVYCLLNRMVSYIVIQEEKKKIGTLYSGKKVSIIITKRGKTFSVTTKSSK